MATFPCSTSLSHPAYHRRILDPHFSHLDWLYWLLTGLTISLTIAITTTSHSHMLHTPINLSCALWPVILALFSKTQTWLDHSSASTFYRPPTAFRMKSVSSLSFARSLCFTWQTPSRQTHCHLPRLSVPYLLFYMPLLGQPGLGKHSLTSSRLCSTPGPFFHFMTCGFSSFTK